MSGFPCAVLASDVNTDKSKRELEVTVVYCSDTRSEKAWFGVSRSARQKFLRCDVIAICIRE